MGRKIRIMNIICFLGVHKFIILHKTRTYLDKTVLKMSAKLGNYNTQRIEEHYVCRFCKKEKVTSYNE